MWKKLVIASLIFQIVFVSVNALIFFGLRGNNEIGDLLRLGYMGERYENYRSTIMNQFDDGLEEKYTEMIDFSAANSSFDIVTVGDSFSQQGKYGYQNFIANAGYSVLNIPRYGYLQQISTVLVLREIDFFRKNGVKFVVVEIVERDISRILRKIPNVKSNESYESVVEKYKNRPKNVREDEFFVNLGNLKYLLFQMLYNFSPNAFFSETYYMEISKKLFSTNINELSFYQNDVNRGLFELDEENIKKLSETLNFLEKTLEQDGVKLIFLPAVNKYNLYKDFLVKNLGNFDMFQILRGLDKNSGNYYLCDSKKILSEKVNGGEQDIFYADDTHWSWKASKYIADDIVNYVIKTLSRDIAP